MSPQCYQILRQFTLCSQCSVLKRSQDNQHSLEQGPSHHTPRLLPILPAPLGIRLRVSQCLPSLEQELTDL